MKIKYFLMVAVVALMTACGTASKVPLTGNQEYTKFMASAKRSTDAKNTAMVQRVGRNLANAVETYLRNNGYANEVKNFQWEFNLVQDKQANAFCMPGGKIVVYEGLLPYTQNEASLAIVLGHEIAHAVAKHSAEQLTKQMNQQMGTNILGTVLNSAVGSGVGDIAAQVAGGYFSFRNLKYSRDNESEADYMGLIFAAMAGYDPANAVTFWKRMAAGTNSNTSEILSDHPSDARRIQNIEKWLPEAEKYYRQSGSSNVRTSTTSTAGTLHIGSSKKASKKRR